jgi:hypothetical protein
MYPHYLQNEAQWMDEKNCKRTEIGHGWIELYLSRLEYLMQP